MGLFFYTKISSIISIGDLPTTNIIEPDFSIDFVIGRLPSYSKYRFEAADKTDEITLILNENQKAN
ncbi:hypothetical protein RLF14_01660, partial [Streptococcus pneumoniae]|nr:hypothetical protein [Streptococcus pneumoniae]MDS2872840.1 hypothetical protein [Streptococcus pneumoniae]MDS3074136.1 hypothetical protein [Streptococcus pneumoniae]MDS3379627.1 hypothetical protein [Streptococcus pneumoniae]MDS4515577.1 hypothetical protein [Streptococcus pneumoniae]